VKNTGAFLELAGFLVLLLNAWFGQWSPGELAWGLWAAGAAQIGTYLVLLGVFFVRQDGAGWRNLGSTVLGIGFLGAMFYWGFRFYGYMLDGTYPYLPADDPLRPADSCPFRLKPPCCRDLSGMRCSVRYHSSRC